MRKRPSPVPGTLNDVTVRPRALAFIQRTVAREKRRENLNNPIQQRERERGRVSIPSREEIYSHTVLDLQGSFKGCCNASHHCVHSRSCDARWRCYTAGCWTIGENVDRKSRSNFSERIDEGIESGDSAKRHGFEQWRNFRDWRLSCRDDAFHASNFALRTVMAQRMCLQSTIANALRHRWKRFFHTSRPALMMVYTIFKRALCGIIPEKTVFGNPRWMEERSRKVPARAGGIAYRSESSPPDTHETYATVESSIIPS